MCWCVCVCLCVAAARRWLVPGLVIPSPTHPLMWFEAAAFRCGGGQPPAHTHTVLTCLWKHTQHGGMQSHSEKCRHTHTHTVRPTARSRPAGTSKRTFNAQRQTRFWWAPTTIGCLNNIRDRCWLRSHRSVCVFIMCV